VRDLGAKELMETRERGIKNDTKKREKWQYSS